MKSISPILSAIFLSGCSCAITTVSYSPANRRPSIEVIERAANSSGFRFDRRESGRSSYSKGVLGMHLTPATGGVEFVNSHCPILPFWTQPGRAFEKRWDDMKLILRRLDSDGFPYRKDSQEAKQAGGSDGDKPPC